MGAATHEQDRDLPRQTDGVERKLGLEAEYSRALAGSGSDISTADIRQETREILLTGGGRDIYVWSIRCFC